MDAGDTFLIPNLGDDHLWMIISDPTADATRVVVVCFLSWSPTLDQACVLHGGEHPFVKHETCVHYPWARIVPTAQLDEMRKRGDLISKAPLSAELLAQIRGCAENGRLPTESYDFLRRQGLVP